MVKKFLLSGVLFVVVFVFLIVRSNSIGYAITTGYIAMSIPWGWSATGKWLNVRFSMQMGAIDIMLLALRIALSLVLGFILFPIEVIKLIIANKKAKKTDVANSGNSSENVTKIDDR
jgi:hypothetical protein